MRKVPPFPIFRKRFFGVGTGHPNQLELPQEIDFCAHAIWRAPLPCEASGAHKIALICPVRGEQSASKMENQISASALATDIRCEPIAAQRFSDIGQFSSTIVLMPANCPEVSGGACGKPKHDKPIMRPQARVRCIIVKPVGIISASKCLCLVDHQSRPMAVSAALS